MQRNLRTFLEAIGEDGLLAEIFGVGTRFRVRKLPALFGPCPMCAGSTDVNFSTSKASCELCKQKWNLSGEPIAGERGNPTIWQKRQKYVRARKNGNGHKYSFDEPIRLEDFADEESRNCLIGR